MLNLAIHNEAIQGGVPIPLLTNQPPFVEVGIMAKSSIAESKKEYQPNYKKRKYQTEDMIGMRFGRLTVIGEVEPYIDPSGQTGRKLKLKCDCGDITETLWKCLKRGTTRSCGCLRKEETVCRCKTHGLRGHPLYHIWANMNRRCNNSEYDRFKDWGDRGITVCDEWLNDPSAFIEWAESNGWGKGLLLDRIDVNDGYSPSNCRFVDAGLSARNKRLLTASNTSGFRGLSFNKRDKKWVARIESDCKRYHLGTYSDPIEAARAYDRAAKKLDAGHPLNFPS